MVQRNERNFLMGIIRYFCQCFSGANSENVLVRSQHQGHEAGCSSNQGTSMKDLPEDLILSIMSQLNLKDVVKFSILNKQWAHAPCCLDTIVVNTHMAKKGDEAAFVRGVSHFMQYYVKLQSKFAPTVCLQTFVIVFSLTKHHSTNIDSWIAIALRYGATCLYLSLGYGPGLSPTRPDNEKYLFPWHLLHPYHSSLKVISLRSCIFECRLISKWTSLEYLCLYDTPLTYYDLDRIVHCFPSLRTLVLMHSRVPAKLKFANGHLIDLRVQSCDGLKEIDVLNSTALMNFTYFGPLAPLKLISAPKPTNLTFGIVDADVQYYVFQNLRQNFPGMRKICIFRRCDNLPLLSWLHGRMTSFTLLEELKLYNHPSCGFSLETMAEVLKACPVLRRLEIMPPCKLYVEKGTKSHVQYLHKCLTFIKISGFCGSGGNLELAKFLVQVSEALDHVVIQRNVESQINWYKEHSGKWHGEQEPEFIKDTLLNLTRSKRLTFSFCESLPAMSIF